MSIAKLWLCARSARHAARVFVTVFRGLEAYGGGAAGAVGNDTGPLHIIATAGCPTVALYSFASDPALCAQKGTDVTILRRDLLTELSVDEVEAALKLD